MGIGCRAPNIMESFITSDLTSRIVAIKLNVSNRLSNNNKTREGLGKRENEDREGERRRGVNE